MSNPPINPSSSESGPEDNNRYLTIYGDVHYTPNELSELKKLADDHPELAARIVSNRSQEVLLSHRTERLGMLLAVAFGLVLISGTAWTLVSLGWWQSIMFVASLLSISHVLRTVLKGEFSDTSWFGQIMRGKVNLNSAVGAD